MHIHDMQETRWVWLLGEVSLDTHGVDLLWRDVQNVLVLLPVPQHIDQRLQIPAVFHAHATEKGDDLREQRCWKPGQAHLKACPDVI